MKPNILSIVFSLLLPLSSLLAQQQDPDVFVIPELMFPGQSVLNEVPKDLVQACMKYMKQLGAAEAANASLWIPGSTRERPICGESSVIARLGMKRAYFISVLKGYFDSHEGGEYYLISGVFVRSDGIGPFLYDDFLAKKLELPTSMPVGYGKTFFIDLWWKKEGVWRTRPISWHAHVITKELLKESISEASLLWLTNTELHEKQAHNEKTRLKAMGK